MWKTWGAQGTVFLPKELQASRATGPCWGTCAGGGVTRGASLARWQGAGACCPRRQVEALGPWWGCRCECKHQGGFLRIYLFIYLFDSERDRERAGAEGAGAADSPLGPQDPGP